MLNIIIPICTALVSALLYWVGSHVKGLNIRTDKLSNTITTFGEKIILLTANFGNQEKNCATKHLILDEKIDKHDIILKEHSNELQKHETAIALITQKVKNE